MTARSAADGGALKLLAGLDAGGTKLAIRAETLTGNTVADIEVTASGWEASPAGKAADWLLRQLRAALPDDAKIAAAGVGAQGCDSPETIAALQSALLDRGVPAVVVNDGALLAPAAGLDHGIGIVAGTGSVGVAADDAGNLLLAGGWGWVLGDEGGSAAIVRDATKAVLAAHDAAQPDDGLLASLQRAFGVGTAEHLARAVNDEPTVGNWAPHATVVFAAADAGSVLAARVIDEAAAHLAGLVSTLVQRGAVGRAVVAGGSVIVSQLSLARALQAKLAAEHPGLEFQLLTEPPVAGALVLARRLISSEQTAATG